MKYKEDKVGFVDRIRKPKSIRRREVKKERSFAKQYILRKLDGEEDL